MVPVDSDRALLVEFTIEKESNFKIVTRNIVFYGLCNECDNNKILSG